MDRRDQRLNAISWGEAVLGRVDTSLSSLTDLVTEARAHALEADISDKDVRDASIIAQTQRMTHYALAGYGVVRAFAQRQGLKSDVEVLQDCLDETYGGDRELTRIAETQVNAAAA